MLYISLIGYIFASISIANGIMYPSDKGALPITCMTQTTPISLSKSDVDSLLLKKHYRIHEELTKMLQQVSGSRVAYSLENDKVLIVYPAGYGYIVDISFARKMIEKEALIHKYDPYSNVFGTLTHRYGKNFPLYTNSLIDDLAQGLKISRNRFDFTLESLDSLEYDIYRYDKNVVLAQYFPNIIAYVGEVVMRLRGGHWEMEYDKAAAIWQPTIVDDSGYRHEWLSEVYRVINEPNGHGALSFLVRLSIRKD